MEAKQMMNYGQNPIAYAHNMHKLCGIIMHRVSCTPRTNNSIVFMMEKDTSHGNEFMQFCGWPLSLEHLGANSGHARIRFALILWMPCGYVDKQQQWIIIVDATASWYNLIYLFLNCVVVSTFPILLELFADCCCRLHNTINMECIDFGMHTIQLHTNTQTNEKLLFCLIPKWQFHFN